MGSLQAPFNVDVPGFQMWRSKAIYKPSRGLKEETDTGADK